jgi:hypothetical protein
MVLFGSGASSIAGYIHLRLAGARWTVSDTDCLNDAITA